MTAECCQISPTRTARSWLGPALPHLVAMQRQPLQGDHAEGVADLVAVQHGACLGERQHLDQNVLALRLQPVDSAGVGGVDPPEEAGARLGAGSRTYHDIVHRDHVADLESCFLYRLASDELFGRLVVLDDPGDDLPRPGMTSGDVGARPELADQHDLVAPWIVGQHGGGVSTLEHFASQDAALAALIESMAEEVATDSEVALKRHLVLDEFDRFVGQGRCRHGKLRTQKGPPPDESGPELAPEEGFEPPT